MDYMPTTNFDSGAYYALRECKDRIDEYMKDCEKDNVTPELNHICYIVEDYISKYRQELE